jgi:hypothetical protein
MRELIDLIAARNVLLTRHPYAALSMVSHANTEIFKRANQVRGKAMDIALHEVITYWKG